MQLLKAQVRRLERQLHQLERLLLIDGYDVLYEEDLPKFLETCRHARQEVRADSMDEERLMWWTDMFRQLNVHHLRLMEFEDMEAWQLLLETSEYIHKCALPSRFDHTKQGIQMYHAFQAARAVLRKAIYLYLLKKHGRRFAEDWLPETTADTDHRIVELAVDPFLNPGRS